MPSLKYVVDGGPDDLERLIDGVWTGIEHARLRRRERLRRLKRVSRGNTLRPGHETPLWNALASTIRPLLARPGAKTLLAAELGLHRARMTEFFVQRSAMPDAERTLLLLEWYGRKNPVRHRFPL